MHLYGGLWQIICCTGVSMGMALTFPAFNLGNPGYLSSLAFCSLIRSASMSHPGSNTSYRLTDTEATGTFNEESLKEFISPSAAPPIEPTPSLFQCTSRSSNNLCEGLD